MLGSLDLNKAIGLDDISCRMLKGTLQAKYKFISCNRASHADLRSAIGFRMHHLGNEIFAVKFFNKLPNSAMLILPHMMRRDVIE